MENKRTYTATKAIGARTYSRWQDYKMLVKLNLSTVVVVTSILAYAIVAGSAFTLGKMLFLLVGGYLVTFAANAINQVLEKDFDKNMARTEDRPVTAGRMKPSEAIMFAGIACLVGVSILSMFNPLTALLGMLSFVTYAFVYTPMKRYSTLAVAIGAIPGALPVLIGGTAVSGVITPLALGLFIIQFAWQFPHFWSIGYLGFDDYNKAGYKLLPTENGAIDRNIGLMSLVYIALSVLAIVGLYSIADASMIATLVATAATIVYGIYAYKFHKAFDRDSARSLMFCSFFYMPIVLLGYLIF